MYASNGTEQVPLEACRLYASSGPEEVPLEARPVYASSGTEQVPLEACRRYVSSAILQACRLYACSGTNKYHLRHVGNMPQVVPNVCVSGSRGTPFGGLWEPVL